MVRSWLSVILHYYAFIPSHATHLVKKRRLTRHVPHVPADTTNNDRFLRSNQQQHLLSEFNQAPKEQRIVILAGPHKTASSSVQNNLYTWSSVDPQILPNWAWPVPHEILEYCESNANHLNDTFHLNDIDHLNAKGFYAIVEAISSGPSRNRPLFRKYSKHTVVGFYRNAMETAWKEGYNLIIGTESLDFMGSDTRDGDDMLGKFLNILPLKTTDDGDDGIGVWGAYETNVTVVVNFRAPRVEHLISVWGQCCEQKITFTEFLIALPDSDQNVNRMRILDSFRLAEIFLKHGLDVVLIDMSGIARDGYDISNVVACDILMASCTETEELVSVEEGTIPIPEVKNTRKNKGDLGGVTEEQLHRIEKVLRTYDCNYLHVLEYDNLTVLYNYELKNIMTGCSKTKEVGSISNRLELVERIKSIVMDTDGDSDDIYYANTDANGS